MKAAVFTLQKNESFHLPQWIRYYGIHFNTRDMYVLDHDSHEDGTLEALDTFKHYGGNVRHLGHDTVFDHAWLNQQVHDMQLTLLDQYDYVLFTDADELVVPAQGGLWSFIQRATSPAYRCTGYEVINDRMYRYPFFDKTLLSAIPLTWDPGYHHADPEIPVSGELFLYHLHRMNFDEAWAKSQRWRQHPFDPAAIAGGLSIQNQITDKAQFTAWFYDSMGQPLEDLHERLVREL